jgi:hypothetical protein
MSNETKAIVLTPETVGLFVLILESIMKLAPIIAEGIEGMALPEQTKEEYKARIKIAQDNLPEWI